MSSQAKDYLSIVDPEVPCRSLAEHVRGMGVSTTSAERGDVLNRQGDRGDHVLVIASGYAVAAKRTVTGAQQNVALLVPGDIVDHESFTLGVSRSTATALTPIGYHKIQHQAMLDLFAESTICAAGFWRYVAFQGALAQEWIVNLGQRTAYVRTAHLLCEIVYRSQFAHGSEEQTCEMPLTQNELADTLGLSVVHVNRTLQRLRQEGVIRVRRGRLDILEWTRFSKIAGFEPSYLDLAG